MKARNQLTCLIVGMILGLGLSACGSSGHNTVDGGPAPNVTDSPSFVANTKLIFSLTMAIDSNDDDLDFAIDLNDPYAMPLKIDGDGTVTVQARDIERMVYRVCGTNSLTADCDAHTDLTHGQDIDIVIDSCGRLMSDEDCGNDDDTTYSGIFSQDGSLTIDDLSIRMRTFLVTDELDGFTADDDNSGLAVMNRLVIDLTTEEAAAGTLSVAGLAWDGKNVVLVSAGTISSTVEGLGGSDFIAILAGIFSVDPFTLFNSP